MADNKKEKIDCFALKGSSCDATYRHVPDECHDCPFRKPKRDVTNGKTYPYMNYGSK